MLSSSSSKYSSLPQTDVPVELGHLEQTQLRKTSLLDSVRQACLFALLVAVGFVLGLTIATKHAKCDYEEGRWSSNLPVLKPSWTKFNGSFEFSGKFRGDASPEIDREWGRFTEHPLIDGTASLISVSIDDISRANKTSVDDWLDSTVKYPEESGGGYMATLELFHQLHCLNMLRKAIHPEYYTKMQPLANGTRTPKLATHLDHCVEILRQFISCHADTGLITFHWVKDNDVPYPDFNTWHQCKDPEEVLRWSKAREVPMRTLVTKNLFSELVEMPAAP